MSSWTSDPEVYVKRFDPEKHANDYVVDTEAHMPGGPYQLPTPLGGAAGQPAPQPSPQPTPEPVAGTPALMPAANNCASCHTDKARLKLLAVEKEVKSEKGSGEG